MDEMKIIGKVSPKMNDRIYRLATDLTKDFKLTEKAMIRVRDVLHTLYLFSNGNLVIQRWQKLAERSGWSVDIFRKTVRCLEENGLFTPAEPSPRGFLKGELTWAVPEDVE